MINLIPPEGRTALKREYLLRTGTVFATILSGVFIAGVALMIPTYVLISSQLSSTESEYEKSADVNAEFKEAENAIRNANDIAIQLGGPTNQTYASDVIGEITKRSPQGITLRAFQLERVKSYFPSVQVQGIAESRSILAAFKEALKGVPNVSNVEVPLSDLAKDSNLPFAITITLELPTS